MKKLLWTNRSGGQAFLEFLVMSGVWVLIFTGALAIARMQWQRFDCLRDLFLHTHERLMGNPHILPQLHSQIQVFDGAEGVRGSAQCYSGMKEDIYFKKLETLDSKGSPDSG